MDDYIAGLAFVATLVAASTIIQIKNNRYRRLQKEHQRMLTNIRLIQNRLKKREDDLDKLQRSSAKLLKWRDRAHDLEEELKVTKSAHDYVSAKRLEYLEGFIESIAQKEPNALFLMTFLPKGKRTFEDKLDQMLESAEFEMIIVSPWIKKQMWERIRGPIERFARKGGSLKVFMRGCKSDFTFGLSDDVREEIERFGGRIIFIGQLHAKLYLVDRKEAIVTSANLTKGGIESNYEAGIWLNDPKIIKDICEFTDDLYNLR